jgi:4'-phosphopantetheinyl transferase
MSFFPRTLSLPQAPPRGGGVCLSTCSLDDDTDVSLDIAGDVLSFAETARAARFRFERDRARYVRGRAFLRRALGAATGQDPAKLVLTEIGKGKPFLDDTVHFNLSHSAGLAVLAMSESGPVGIDLEFIDRRIDILGLVRSCFNEAEARNILSLPVPEQPARFFAFWTAKEARMKLTGDGMSLPPQQIALDIEDGVPVGYLRPDSPATQAVFIDLGRPETICCLAMRPTTFSYVSKTS